MGSVKVLRFPHTISSLSSVGSYLVRYMNSGYGNYPHFSQFFQGLWSSCRQIICCLFKRCLTEGFIFQKQLFFTQDLFFWELRKMVLFAVSILPHIEFHSPQGWNLVEPGSEEPHTTQRPLNGTNRWRISQEQGWGPSCTTETERGKKAGMGTLVT